MPQLAKKRTAEKKLAITVFSFPPDKGNVGTAAYLNVFGSIYRVLQVRLVMNVASCCTSPIFTVYILSTTTAEKFRHG